MSINSLTKARAHFGALLVGLGPSDGGISPVLTLPAITGVSTANPGVVTVPAHGLTVGKHYPVTITGVVGATQANGTFFATVLSSSTFSIPVNVTGAYSSGGTAKVTLTQKSIKGIYATTPITITPTASMTAGLAYTTTVAFTGPAVGDLILAVPPTNLTVGLAYEAYVTAAGVITLVITNPTAGTLVAAAGAWTFVLVRL